MDDESIVEMPQPLGLFAADLMERANEFLQVFERLSEDTDGIRHAAYFTLAHSLELFLKSYLAANGVSKEELCRRALGHNLRAIYDRCEMASFPKIDYLRDFAYSVHHTNGDYDFRYPTGYILTVPSPVHCLHIMKQLKLALEPLISQASVSAQLQWMGDTRHLKGKKIRWSD
jgi:hypothetical protein